MVTILDVSTTPKGEDPRGEIIAASITLKGRGVLGKVVYKGENESYRPGNCVKITSPEDTSKTLRIGSGEWFPDVSTNVEPDLEILLMLIRVIERQQLNILKSTIYCLALKRSTSSGGLYERIGCAGTGSLNVQSAFKKGGLDMAVTIA